MVKKNNFRKVFAAVACVSCAVTCAAAFAACDKPDEEGGEAALTSGTYWAEYEKSAMGSTLTYTVHITLDAEKNTYYFSSYYVMDNEYAHATYVVSESGTYTDNGTEAVFKTEGKNDLTATVSEDAFTLDKDVAGMGISTAELTYEKGGAPIYVTYKVDGEEYKKVGYKNATDEVIAVAEPDEKTGYTFSWGTVPATAGTGATVNGVYTADNATEEPDEDEDEEEVTVFTYWAELQKSAMSSMITYTVHITLDAENNTYYFSSYYVMNGYGTRVVSESGTYTDNGETLVFSTEGKNDFTATVSENSFTLAKDVAGMGMSNPELTYELGEAPVYVIYYIDGEEYDKVGYKSATDEVVAIAEADDISGYTFSWLDVPATAGTGANVFGNYITEESDGDELVGGDYNVELSWYAMLQYNPATEYHVIIDAEEKTFEILNQTADSKGAGTITFENGVYTLNYENGKEATFIFNSQSGKITFTSKLWINTIALNRVADDGVTFVPYTAVIEEN